jgi:hypothetical protein
LQIAVKNGVLQKWGLVEFKTAEDAEAVLTSGLQLRGQPIRKLLHNPHTVLCIYIVFIRFWPDRLRGASLTRK